MTKYIKYHSSRNGDKPSLKVGVSVSHACKIGFKKNKIKLIMIGSIYVMNQSVVPCPFLTVVS